MALQNFISKRLPAIGAAWLNMVDWFFQNGTDSGAANAYVVSLGVFSALAPFSLSSGQVVRFIPANTNTGASTANIAGSGIKQIVNSLGQPLSGGELVANYPAWLQYDGTKFFIVGWAVTPDRQITSAEVSAAVTPSNFSFPPGDIRRYGAIGDSTTDCTTAIQRALNVALFSGVVYIPAAVGYYKITAALTLPNRGSGKGLTVYGDGRFVSRILQATAAADVFDSNNVWATLINDITIRDLSLEGGGTARYGIRCVAIARSLFQNLNMLNFATAGLYVEDAILNKLMGCHILGNQDGIVQTTSPNSIPNGWAITDSIVSSNTRYAVNLLQGAGWCIKGSSFEANSKGGLRFLTNDGGLQITGCYFEANADTTAGTFDIQLGFGSGVVSGVLIAANRFQGSATDANYYPLRIKNGDAIICHGNTLGAGSRFCAFDAAVSISNSNFGPLHFSTGGADPSTGAAATYGGIPSTFVQFNNRMMDNSVIPTDGANFIAGDFPTGGLAAGWSATLAGASSWFRAPNTGATPDEHNGRPVGMLTRSGGTAQVATGWVVSATQNSRVRGRYVTFLLDVYVNNAAAKGFTLILDDGAAQSFTLSASAANTVGYQTYAVSGFFSTSTTLVAVRFRADQDAEFRIGSARVYVGLDSFRMPAMTGDFVWYASAIPTTGTWADGDVVKMAAPVAGATPGWTCTTPGTGGGALVFRPQANLT